MANVEQELERRARVSGKHLCTVNTGMIPEMLLFTVFGKYTQFTFKKGPPIPPPIFASSLKTFIFSCTAVYTV